MEERERSKTMKIVTYNVNGLRQRISQFGSLLKLLNSFDADVICFQETKLRRQELTTDVAMADGYESFFCCTRTNDKGRTGYSGVVTFCRVKSAFSSMEVALPVAAEEGFTGILVDQNGESRIIGGLEEEFNKDELVKVDSEGRCVITDHGHFVIFNVYGPRAGSDDRERIEFKSKFYEILQKIWENLFTKGTRIIVVGDLNIAPTTMDRCDASPDFENNEFRKWFRSMLVQSGGHFVDVFRAIHPHRKEAYTCWSTSTGAEQFNYGTRIDHILYAGPCLHQENDHNFIRCHVKECDILTEYKRLKPEHAPRYIWKGGLNMKLEGSDHAPVYMSLVQIPDINPHSTPSLSARYLPMIRGLQQTLATVLIKRQTCTQVESCMATSLASHENTTKDECTDGSSSSNAGYPNDSQRERLSSTLIERPRKKERKSTQLLLKSFFSKRSDGATDNIDGGDDGSKSKPEPCKANEANDIVSSEPDRKNTGVVEWQRIKELMRSSLPLCKGHKEPCVSRVVKKTGPNFQRRFYVCARAEGPASNPEANCGYFKWASSSKSKQK